ncbi:mannosyl-oligosaccharide alpha-1-2-mannosidase 1B [Penicillium argentinense]|uniref:alpha-1,2-Mannosidase n=1 Tax=Penicillium argentinense TaxID=1131581 RepID=A0A9W9JV89_9EURO|nr:mannosyl-oligosaccharide alpha-1-2-mannosidase 1B [Penicillium argentinense]KAJ5082828.1 mannosyl-oligosaccharide alpha-1-2-mannosidase 1B [Penicillium argentinense]
MVGASHILVALAAIASAAPFTSSGHTCKQVQQVQFDFAKGTNKTRPVVDGIDTAIVMGLTGIVEQQLKHIVSIDFTNSADIVNFFDINIRYLGGLLSAYDLIKSGRFPNPYDEKLEALLSQARILATTISPVFDTATGLPAQMNLSSQQVIRSTTAVNDLTGGESFRQMAQKAEKYLVNPKPAPAFPALVGTEPDTETGITFDGGWLAGVDSFIEVNNSDHTPFPPYFTFLSQLDQNGSIMWTITGNKGDGQLSLAAYNKNATNRAYAAKNGYIIEDPSFRSYPEPLESNFYAYRIMGGSRWQDYNWEIFQALNTTRSKSVPYAEITDVNAPYGGELVNFVSSFYFTEALKYLYLSFTEPDVVSLDDLVFNTECLPVLKKKAC